MKISEKTQKMHFFQNSCTELAKIKNLHSTICLKVFPSSGRVALPPAFARNEQRGAPRPVKLTKPAGRNGAKLTVDCTDYAHTFGLRMGK